MKRALITGITGQDGAYLSQFLLRQGYRVFGGWHRGSTVNTWRLEKLGILADVDLIPFELSDETSIIKLIELSKPDELYNFAAQSFVPVSFDQPSYVGDINGSAVARILAALYRYAPDCRFYQASSSEMFGKVSSKFQDESTPFYPRSPYAAAKAYAHFLTVNYREAYGLHASSGIAFNHESPLRGNAFVTKRIVNHLVDIKCGKLDWFHLGNLNAKRDWGFAGDYVVGMWKMLQEDKPGDYVLATGKTHSVREFAQWAADAIGIGIEWQGEGEKEIGINMKTGKPIIKVCPSFYRPCDVGFLRGNASKAYNILHWQPNLNAQQLASMMINDEIGS